MATCHKLVKSRTFLEDDAFLAEVLARLVNPFREAAVHSALVNVSSNTWKRPSSP